jgi:hypothetical protein
MSHQDSVPTQTLSALPANLLILLVGVTGFEPATYTSRITAPKGPRGLCHGRACGPIYVSSASDNMVKNTDKKSLSEHTPMIQQYGVLEQLSVCFCAGKSAFSA